MRLTREERQRIDNTRIWAKAFAWGAVATAVLFQIARILLYGGTYSLI